MLITTPSRCSFELYFSKNGIWGNDVEGDEWTDMFIKLANTKLYKRLLFDTPQKREQNKQFFTYNPYLVSSSKNNEEYLEELYGKPPERVDQENNLSRVSNLKSDLEKMAPYITFLSRIHEDVMEKPTTTHLMFQKSIFYEVLFYYCLNKTSQDMLTNVILGANDFYLGFCIASIDKMREKYTGKQYVAIVPRGFGKTRCIRLVTAVALITFRGCEIFTMAHIKSLSSALKDDVESILNAKFPASRYNYKMFKHQDSIMLNFQGEKTFNRLKYASACNPSSLRGNDPHIGFLDETLCVSKDAYAVINAMNQRLHTKIGFVSSPIANKKDDLINLVVNMPSKCSQTNFYRICLFCLDRLHVQYSTSESGCYKRMFAPKHIMYTEDNKNFEGVLTRTETSYENELGIIYPEDINVDSVYRSDTGKSVFTKQFIAHICNPMTHIRLSELPYEDEPAYSIYIDPAYHPSSQSAIAICCVRTIGEGKQCYVSWIESL